MLALIILLFAIFFVYFVKIISTFIAAHRAHKIAKQDPEAQPGDVIERPSFRAVAREVTHAMFPPRQQQNAHDPMHRRSSAEIARANWNSSLATAVVRVETRDGELPSYRRSTLPCRVIAADASQRIVQTCQNHLRLYIPSLCPHLQRRE